MPTLGAGTNNSSDNNALFLIILPFTMSPRWGLFNSYQLSGGFTPGYCIWSLRDRHWPTVVFIIYFHAIFCILIAGEMPAFPVFPCHSVSSVVCCFSFTS
jgi:hypothetical protein